MSDSHGPTPAIDPKLLVSMDQTQAEAIFNQGKEAVVFALLQLAKMAAEASSASTPSAMIPVYLKQNVVGPKRKAGAQNGHKGSRRAAPERIDHQRQHRAEVCPDCGGPLNRCAEIRTRYIEDIPEIKPEVTEHIIHRDWCPRCQQKVEAPVADALPGSTIGLRTLALSAWQHYALGNTLDQIVDVFNFHMQLKITPGGLVQMWYRLQETIFPWYEQLHQEAMQSARLHADETGWRVAGQTHWLWCFGNDRTTFYLIDRSRGSPALDRFFTTHFAGTLITDFWASYNAVDCGSRQMCLVHLLRELSATLNYKNPGSDWPEFEMQLGTLLRDSITVWKDRDSLAKTDIDLKRAEFQLRLSAIISKSWNDEHVLRLMKRLRRHENELFTFLDHDGVPFDNNHAERSIRPAVILRKNSYGNRSEQGSDCQAVLMSIFRSLRQRGHDPIRTVIEAVSEQIKTGTLPPMPA